MCIQMEGGDHVVAQMLETAEELNQLQDLNTILDRLLDRACRFSGADAGSIFLVENDRLKSSAVINETLFPKREDALVYQNISIPIDETSIVGYVATKGGKVVVDDAYKLDRSVPYTFNRSFDEKTNYRTQSVMGVPMKSYRNRLVGVMQLINAKDESGRVGPFSEISRTYMPLFATNASGAIERGLVTREMVLRMMRMAEMRDPAETGAHVQRVGAYSAMIFARHARNRGVSEEEIKHSADLIRIAAMLHDVGKVGIPDRILKKKGRLTREEFETMKWHTIFGAQLFTNATSELDRLCRDIALYHHQKWSGDGYPGLVQELSSVPVGIDGGLGAAPMKGEEIPLAARVVALADVYDALMSKRAYKDAWPESRVLELVRSERANHFDPDVVESFFQIYGSIRSVWYQFPDTSKPPPNRSGSVQAFPPVPGSNPGSSKLGLAS